jgi:site-specific DNA-methyltransferase (adenine-specific)
MRKKMKAMVNQIVHGDCLEVMKDIDDKSVDMVLCDLPYGATKNKWDIVIPFEPLWEQYKRIIRDGRVTVLFGSQPFTSVLVMSNVKMFKYDWVWDKVQTTNFLNAKRQPLRQHESICVFYKGKSVYNRQFADRKLKDIRKNAREYKFNQKYKGCQEHTGDYDFNYAEDYDNTKINPKSIIKFTSQPKRVKALHPTQKPVALLEYLIRTYTNKGDLVLDNCIGSGTTAEACMNSGRRFIGIEKEKKFVTIARNRVAKHRLDIGL